MSAEHEEYEEKNFTEPDNVNVGLVGTITVVGAILVVSIALALTALVRSEAKAHGEDVNTFANLGTVSRLKAEQTGRLESAPSWADKVKGFVSLPIGRAMELTTADIQKDPELATKAVPGADEPEPSPDGGADGAAAEGADPSGEAPGAGDEKAPKQDDTAQQDSKTEPGKAEGAEKPAPKAPGTKGKQPKAPKGATPAAPAPAPAPTVSGAEN